MLHNQYISLIIILLVIKYQSWEMKKSLCLLFIMSPSSLSTCIFLHDCSHHMWFQICKEFNIIFKHLFDLFLFLATWVFVDAHGLSLVEASRGYSSLQCVGFSLWWLLLLRSMGSRCMGFSSCGTRAQ